MFRVLKRLLGHPEFTIAVFMIFCALLGWPFITVTGPERPVAMFYYLYIVWACIIVFLFLSGRNTSGSDDQNGEA